MTIQIPKAQASDDFAARVEAFRQAKLAHHQTTDVPAPTDHPLVESCVKRVMRDGEADDYIADYAIVEPSLDQQKNDLTAEVGKQEQAALAKVMSPAKRALLTFSVADLAHKQKEQLTPEDKILLAKNQLLLAHGNAVSRHGAKLRAKIEDLTDETIAAWTPETFPEA
jgi:hypothetical protein